MADYSIEKPAISVIIPLYNKASHLARSLRSVLNQTYRDFEIIVVDDGSTDGGAEIARQYLRPEDCLIVQQNAGASAARNRGLAAMSGSVAAFLDADDMWFPNHLEHLACLADRFPQAGLYATGYASVGWKGKLGISVSIDSARPQLYQDIFQLCLDMNIMQTSSLAVRKCVLEAVGGFPEGVNLVEDLEFTSRVALRYPTALHPAVSAVFFQDTENKSTTVFRRKTGIRYLADRLVEMLDSTELAPDVQKSLSAFARRLTLAYANNFLLSGDTYSADEIMSHTIFQRLNAEQELSTLRLKRKIPRRLLRIGNRLHSLRWLIHPRLSRNGVAIRLTPWRL